jgi:hypothetical protein
MASGYDLQKDMSISIGEFVCRQHDRSYLTQGHDNESLPASLSELIIMALVDLRRPASLADIDLWITKLLGAEHHTYQPTGYGFYPTKRIHTVIQLLTLAFDLPVKEWPREPPVEAHGRSQTLSEGDIQGTPPAVPPWTTLSRWTTPIRDAVPFPRRRLFSPWSPDKYFPIMKLPVKLREYIFKYALALPSGATMRPRGSLMIPRSGSERWALLAPRWHSDGLEQYDVESDFLALLRVSKSFYREAMPFLWSQVLIVGTSFELCRLLRDTTPWKLVEQIEIHLRGDDERFMHSGKYVSVDDDYIATLAALPRLRKLIVHLMPLSPVARFTRAQLDTPSVASLRRHVRGLEELVVHDLVEGCKDVLRAELVGARKVSAVS